MRRHRSDFDVTEAKGRKRPNSLPILVETARKPHGPGMRIAVVHPPEPTMASHVRYLLEHGMSEWAGSAGWPSWELPFVQWAEGNGIELDYAVNADLELVPGLLEEKVRKGYGEAER